MTPQKKTSFPFDPAWIALGLAALVLVGTMIWLIAVRTVPRAEAPVPAAAVAGAPAAPAAVAAPDPQLLARLAAAEASLAQIAARPVAEGTTPQAVAGLLEQRIAALAPPMEARFGTLEGRLGVIEARTAEAAQATTQRLAEAQRALTEGRTAVEQSIREGLAAVGARIEAQEQALRAQTERAQQVAEAGRQQQAALAAQQAFAEQLGTRLSALEAASQQQQAATEALQRAVTAADSALQQQASAAEEARRQVASAAEQARRQFTEQVNNRLDALQQAQEQAARTASEALNQRVAPLEQSARQMAEAQRSDERRAAIEAVRQQLAAGRPLGPVLPRLGGEPPQALARYSTTAPPTEAALRQSFEEAARNARGTGTPEGALNRLSSVLTIRRGEEVLVGDTNEGTVERARRALEAGDLDGALTQLGRLPDATKSAMRSWLNEAEGLLAARNALRQLAGG